MLTTVMIARCANRMVAIAMAEVADTDTILKSITVNARMPANERRNIRMACQIRSRMQSSPVAHEIKLPEHTIQWRSVSAGDVDGYILMNVWLCQLRLQVVSSLNKLRTETRHWHTG